MIQCSDFANVLEDAGVRFFSGVPDSLLKEICGYLSDHFVDNHIIAANEGNAVALAAGFHMATGEIPLVYLQNSGLGNTINPLTSLVSEDVYQIPLVLMVGWRGEPGVSDEPQHRHQGKITRETLDLLSIPYATLTAESNENDLAALSRLIKQAQGRSGPVAIVVSKGTFAPYAYKSADTDSELTREEAVVQLAEAISSPKSLIVSTTGKLSRELYEFRKASGGDIVDFYNVGSMGHLSQIALGLAKYAPDRRVYCFDGDGAALMHLGGLAIAAAENLENYHYIVFNNGAHDSVGGQPTIAGQIDFPQIAEAVGFRSVLKAENSQQLGIATKTLAEEAGPSFLEVLVQKGARKDLGRPTETPAENKIAFMKRIGSIR